MGQNLLFLTLRDSTGLTQLILDRNHDAFTTAAKLNRESVVSVSGIVHKRPDDMVNRSMATGLVEVYVDQIEILNKSEPNLGMQIDYQLSKERRIHAKTSSPEIRLANRYLDLRGAEMQRNLRVRNAVVHAARKQLIENESFLEIETPLLFKSTPEGAKEFIVPSRSHSPGTCFALPQSPQQYKQLLMASGVQRYMQFAKCFRDEGNRADRQPEFTQLDLEMAFAEADDVRDVIEGVVRRMWLAAKSAAIDAARTTSIPLVGKEREWELLNIPKPLLAEIPQNIPTLSYDTAMQFYGSDKPDTRYELMLGSDFKSVLEKPNQAHACSSLFIPNSLWKPNRKQLMSLFEGMDDTMGVAAIKVDGDDVFKIIHMQGGLKDVLLSLTSDEKDQIGRPEPGVYIVTMSFGSFRSSNVDEACKSLGKIRIQVASHAKIVMKDMALLWVTGFPLFELGDDDKLSAVHHPFTAPVDEPVVWDFENVSNEILQVRSKTYDLVCNGVELGGGSVRIHDPDMQRHVFHKLLGMPQETVTKLFGHLLRALGSGCPPHAGIALGLDRLISVMCETSSIADVIAFPKTTSGNDLLTGSPSRIPDEVLKNEYKIQVVDNS